MDQYKERYSSLQAHLDIPTPSLANAIPDRDIAINAHRSRFIDYVLISLLDVICNKLS